jgi:hypothetical protein
VFCHCHAVSTKNLHVNSLLSASSSQNLGVTSSLIDIGVQVGNAGLNGCGNVYRGCASCTECTESSMLEGVDHDILRVCPVSLMLPTTSRLPKSLPSRHNIIGCVSLTAPPPLNSSNQDCSSVTAHSPISSLTSNKFTLGTEPGNGWDCSHSTRSLPFTRVEGDLHGIRALVRQLVPG